MTSAGSGSVRVAESMARLAESLHAEPDQERTLSGIVSQAVAMVPGAEMAGISLVQRKAITPKVPTDSLVEKLDHLQSQLGEGPCLQAIDLGGIVQIDDMASETRWPRFADEAARQGVGGLLAFQLFTADGVLGSVNLYAKLAHAFGEESRVVGELFARHAGLALAQVTTQHHLSEALRNRDVIGQAKGILMERNQVTENEAFDLLVRTSQDVNLKLTEVARWLADDVAERAAGTDR